MIGMFKCKCRCLELVDWGKNRTNVVWYKMIFLKINYIDLLLMRAKDLNATSKETEGPTEGIVGKVGIRGG